MTWSAMSLRVRRGKFCVVENQAVKRDGNGNLDGLLPKESAQISSGVPENRKFTLVDTVVPADATCGNRIAMIFRSR
jgi:hypothetical protein